MRKKILLISVDSLDSRPILNSKIHPKIRWSLIYTFLTYSTILVTHVSLDRSPAHLLVVWVNFCDWRWKGIGQWEMAAKFWWLPGNSQAIHSGSARNDWCPYLLEVNDSNASYQIVTNPLLGFDRVRYMSSNRAKNIYDAQLELLRELNPCAWHV